SMSGGGLSLASADGGATDVTVVRTGAQSTAWWHGASGDWLAYGHMGWGALLRIALTAQAEPTGALTQLAAGKVPGAVQALAYCPAGSADGLGDVLLA